MENAVLVDHLWSDRLQTAQHRCWGAQGQAAVHADAHRCTHVVANSGAVTYETFIYKIIVAKIYIWK